MALELPTFNKHDREQLHNAALQMFVLGFKGKKLPKTHRTILAEGLGGVILFRRNVESVEQVSALTASVHEAAGDVVPFVSLDQEGGRVVRIKEPLTPIPPMRKIGRFENPAAAADVAEVIATEVGALGFNLNYSPVVDVDTNPDNPVIGDRAFSRDPEWVARMGGAFVAGHLAAGVVPCAKHFPGHGDTDTDSHHDLPVIHHDQQRLETIEFLPFQKLIAVEVPMIMTAHVIVEKIDSEHPATLSRPVMRDLLRDKMGYDGIVITDDLEMAAVADRYSIEEMIERGLDASVDIFLICHDFDKFVLAFDRLIELAERDDEIYDAVFRSANRIAATKKSLLGSWPKPWVPGENWQKILGCAEHQAILSQFGDAAFDGDDPTKRA